VARKSKTEKPATGLQDFLFTCVGHIGYRPRILSRRVTSDVARPYCLFSLRFYNICVGTPDLTDELLYRKLEDKVRSVFESTGIYTDQNGVICEFRPPSCAWWIEVEQVSYVLAPPLLLNPSTTVNPITIEGK
jgi:hypothetical protein